MPFTPDVPSLNVFANSQPVIIGTSITGNAPAATNIITATEVVTYAVNGIGPQSVIFSGTITLPVDTSTIASIAIYAANASGNQNLLDTIFPPYIGTITYTGNVLQPLDDEIWTLTFVTYNVDGAPSASPFTIPNINIYPAGLDSITASEIGPKYISNGIIYSTFSLVPVVTNNQVPMNVGLWVDFDDGNGYKWIALVNFKTVGQAYTFDYPSPINPTQINWKVAASVETLVPTNIPPVGYVFSNFTVSPVGSCLSTDITNAHFIEDPATSDIIDYALSGSGNYDWSPYQLDWSQPQTSYDINYWRSFVTLQKGYATTGSATITSNVDVVAMSGTFSVSQVGYLFYVNGIENQIATYVNSTHITLVNPVSNGAISWEIWNPAPDYWGGNDNSALYHGILFADSGVVQGVAENDNLGTIVTINGSNQPNLPFPVLTNPDGSSNLYRSFRFWIYAVSKLNQGSVGAGAFTLQTIAWSGTDHYSLSFSAQPSALDLGQSNTFTFNGTDFYVNAGKFTILSVDMSKAINLSSQFQVSGGLTSITNLSAGLIITGELQVGGGSNRISQMKIFDTSPTPVLIGFVGDDSAGSGYVGAWFQKCGIGGSGPLSPNFFADSSGNVVASSVAVINSGTWGWIGTNGTYYGAWFKQLYIGGTSPANAQIVANSSGNVTIAGSITISYTQVSGLGSLATQSSVSSSTTGLTGTIQTTYISGNYINTGTLNASLVSVINLSANSINTGTLNASLVSVINLSAKSINTGTLSVSFLSAGTATFSGDVIFSRGSGSNPSVDISSAGIYLYSYSQDATHPYVLISSGSFIFTNGSTQLIISSSYIEMYNSGGYKVIQIDTSNGMQIFGPTGVLGVQVVAAGVTITSPSVTMQLGTNTTYPTSAVFTNGSTATIITGNSIGCGYISTVSLSTSSLTVGGPTMMSLPSAITYGSAGAGYITPPTIQGFIEIIIGTTTYKIAYYNV